MDHSYPYIASLTREPFLFYEMRSTAKLMSEGLPDEAIAEEIVRQNLFQSFQHGDAGHSWHPHITENDLGFMKSGHFQPVHTIVSLKDFGDPQRIPVDR